MTSLRRSCEQRLEGADLLVVASVVLVLVEAELEVGSLELAVREPALLRRISATRGSSRWIDARPPPHRRLDRGRRAPDRLGEREAGEQVDHVVLAQVDEAEAERERVDPADGRVTGPDLRQDARGHHGRAEVK